MSSVAEIQSTLADAGAHVQAVDAKLDAVVAMVQSLRDQVVAGSVATQADLDQIMAAAQAVQAPAIEAEQKEDTLLAP